MWNAKTTTGSTALGAALAFALAAAPANASFTQEPGSPFAVGVNPYGVLIGDFNADTRPDVVAVNGTSSTVSVLLREPAGGFAQETGSPLVGSGPNFGAVADFNADNRPDVAVANYVGGSVSVLLRQPGGGSRTNPVSRSPPGRNLGRRRGLQRRQPRLRGDQLNWQLTILLRKAGGGVHARGPRTRRGSLARNIAAADFNADGRPDLAVTNSAAPTSRSCCAARPGRLRAGSPAPPIEVGASPAGIAGLNGDGRPIWRGELWLDTVSLLRARRVGASRRRRSRRGPGRSGSRLRTSTATGCSTWSSRTTTGAQRRDGPAAPGRGRSRRTRAHPSRRRAARTASGSPTSTPTGVPTSRSPTTAHPTSRSCSTHTRAGVAGPARRGDTDTDSDARAGCR